MPPEGYTLVWSDEFEGDTTKWTNLYGLSSYVANSNLMFDGKGGSVKSTQYFLYGYIEIKSKFADTTNKGYTNILWFLNRYPDIIWKEIDLMETATGPMDTGNNSYGINKINMHVHCPTQPSAVGSRYDTGLDLGKAFHLYGIDWTPNYIDFYFDDIKIWRYEPTPEVPMPDLPVNIILGLCKKRDATKSSQCWPTTEVGVPPATMYIDHVRVYNKFPVIIDSVPAGASIEIDGIYIDAVSGSGGSVNILRGNLIERMMDNLSQANAAKRR